MGGGELFNAIQEKQSFNERGKSWIIFTTGSTIRFDTKYLALADRNMHVRFSLKVVWES